MTPRETYETCPPISREKERGGGDRQTDRQTETERQRDDRDRETETNRNRDRERKERDVWVGVIAEGCSETSMCDLNSADVKMHGLKDRGL